MTVLLYALPNSLPASVMPRLREHYAQVASSHPFATQSKSGGYGGYSLTSDSGQVTDGWVGAGGLMHQRQLDGSYAQAADAEAVKAKHNILPLASYHQPTPICTGAAAQVLDFLRAIARQPIYRSRYGVHKAGHRLGWHVDGISKAGVWRIHLPIVSEPGARFCWREPSGRTLEHHMQADGTIYFTRIDVEHGLVNETSSDRVHLHTMTAQPISPVALGAQAVCGF